MVDVSDEELSMVIIDDDDDDIEVETIQTNNVQIVLSKTDVHSEQTQQIQQNDHHEMHDDDASDVCVSLPSTIAVSGDFVFKPVSFVYLFILPFIFNFHTLLLHDFLVLCFVLNSL